MENRKIKDLSLTELYVVMTTLNDVCDDSSRFADIHPFISGDVTFESLPDEWQKAIWERQTLYNYKDIVRTELIERIKGMIDGQD